MVDQDLKASDATMEISSIMVASWTAAASRHYAGARLRNVPVATNSVLHFVKFD